MTSIIFEEDKPENLVLSVIDACFKAFENKAEQGDDSAQNSLGWCYSNGFGVEKDEQKTVEWYQKAAEQGNTGAQNNLGWCYENGTGVRKMNKRQLNGIKKQLNKVMLMHKMILVDVI